MYPTDLKYTRDHEWVRTEGHEATVGITDFAQQQLGDVVFVDLPAVGRQVAQGDVFGTSSRSRRSPNCSRRSPVRSWRSMGTSAPTPRRSTARPTRPG